MPTYSPISTCCIRCSAGSNMGCIRMGFAPFCVSYYLQVIGICFVVTLFVCTLAGSFIFDSITSKSVVTLLMSFCFYLTTPYISKRQHMRTSNIFYGNFIFSFSIDTRTTKLKSSREIAYGFYAIM